MGNCISCTRSAPPQSTVLQEPTQSVQPAIDYFSKQPVDIISEVLGYLSITDLAHCSQVCKKWKSVVSPFLLKSFLAKKIIPLTIFDGSDWAKLANFSSLGCDPSDAPPIDTGKLLSALNRCRSSLIKENAGLTLLAIPKKITLQKILDFAESHNVGKTMGIEYISPNISSTIRNTEVEKTYLVAITNHVFEESRNIPFGAQEILVNKIGCEIPKLLELFVLLFTTFMRSGERLYHEDPSNNEWIVTRFSDQIRGNPYVGFTAEGIFAGINAYDAPSRGVGGVFLLENLEQLGVKDLSETQRDDNAVLLNAPSLKNISPLLRVFDETDWFEYVNLSSFGLDVSDAPPLDIGKLISALDKLLPSLPIEGKAGLTLLTIPKGLTFNILVTIIESLKEGNIPKFRKIWARLLEQFGDRAVKQTYRILITNNVLEKSRNITFSEQKELVSSMGGEMPKLLEVFVLLVVTFIRSGERLYNVDISPSSQETYTRCSNQINDDPLIVGGFSLNGITVSTSGPFDSLDIGSGGVFLLDNLEQLLKRFEQSGIKDLNETHLEIG